MTASVMHDPTVSDDLKRLMALERAFESLGIAIQAAARARGDLRSIGADDERGGFASMIAGIEKLAVAQSAISEVIGNHVAELTARARISRIEKLHPLSRNGSQRSRNGTR